MTKRILLPFHLVAAFAAAAPAMAQPAAGAPPPPAYTPPPADAAPAAPPPAATPPASAPLSDEKVSKLADQVEGQRADLNEQDARVTSLEKQVEELEERLAAAHARPEPPPSHKRKHEARSSDPLAGIRVTGYVQAQYESHQDSEDQLQQGGTLWNQDRFLVRRARLRAEREWRYSSVMIELDGNTVHGGHFGIQHAEASVFYRGDNAGGTLPLAMLTFGMFDTPFGHELLESPRVRPFMERSLASLSFWPSEPDIGVRLQGRVAFLTYQAAIVNGEPLGEKSGFPLQDPNGKKDVVGRIGVDAPVSDDIQVSGGVSALNGYGFHAGTDNTKDILVWNDINEDGIFQATELKSIEGQTGQVSQNFFHWAVGADAQLRVKTRLGFTQVSGEIMAGSNMDRGFFIADPVLTHIDTRELGYYVGVTQEVTPYAIVGLRYDYYNPNADFLSSQGGKILPYSYDVKTWSPMVGLVLPRRAKLLFQYDFIRDYLALNSVGVPADRKNNVWTLRLQGEL